MRALDFTSVDNYECLYEALIVSGTKGAETRMLGRVISALEDIGVKQDTSALFTLAKPAEIFVEEAEFELVKRLVNNVEWAGRSAKKGAALLDWLDEVPKVELKATK